MTQEEYDRLIEVLFFLYFDTKDKKTLGTKLFWDVITSVCTLYDINNLAVTQAVRILMSEENKPNEKEMYYLLNKLGLSVRPIRRITGIYWQKQKQYAVEFETTPPVIKRRLVDVVYKKSVYDFVAAMYEINGIFADVPKENLYKQED